MFVKVVISNLNARKLYLDMVGVENFSGIVKRGIKSYELSKFTSYICLGVDYDPHWMPTIPWSPAM